MSKAWLGRLLRGVRAGKGRLLDSGPKLSGVPCALEIKTSAWPHGAAIPRRHAGRGVGDNVSPALSWRGVPDCAAELVLVVEDADAPLPRPFVHLLAYGIAPDRAGFAEGALTPTATAGAVFGRNTAGPPGYAGPRALPGHGPHSYRFQLFALSAPSALSPGADLSQVRVRVEALAIARGSLTGTYEQV